MCASGSLSFYLTSCISGHNTATEHTETFEKQPLKTLFLCDLCGKKDFRKRSYVSVSRSELHTSILLLLQVISKSDNYVNLDKFRISALTLPQHLVANFLFDGSAHSHVLPSAALVRRRSLICERLKRFT